MSQSISNKVSVFQGQQYLALDLNDSNNTEKRIKYRHFITWGAIILFLQVEADQNIKPNDCIWPLGCRLPISAIAHHRFFISVFTDQHQIL